MMTMIDRMLEMELVRRPLVFNLALGFLGTLPATPENILHMKHQLPDDAVWTLKPHHAETRARYGISG